MIRLRAERFDRFVKEDLRVGGYVRYMDDMVLWGESPRILNQLRDRCYEFLSETLSLEAKPASGQHSQNGMNFLGCRVFPTHVELNRTSKIRFRTKLRAYQRLVLSGAMSASELQMKVDALLAFTRSANIKSWRFRTAVLSSLGEKAEGSFRDAY